MLWPKYYHNVWPIMWSILFLASFNVHAFCPKFSTVQSGLNSSYYVSVCLIGWYCHLLCVRWLRSSDWLMLSYDSLSDWPMILSSQQHGYTFVAEARSVDQGIPPGRWRLRLIGSLSPLPTPQHGEVNAAFQTTELHDFYVPNDRNIVFRCVVLTASSQFSSIKTFNKMHC